jgi:hypothetical protein
MTFSTIKKIALAVAVMSLGTIQASSDRVELEAAVKCAEWQMVGLTGLEGLALLTDNKFIPSSLVSTIYLGVLNRVLEKDISMLSAVLRSLYMQRPCKEGSKEGSVVSVHVRIFEQLFVVAFAIIQTHLLNKCNSMLKKNFPNSMLLRRVSMIVAMIASTWVCAILHQGIDKATTGGGFVDFNNEEYIEGIWGGIILATIVEILAHPIAKCLERAELTEKEFANAASDFATVQDPLVLSEGFISTAKVSA